MRIPFPERIPIDGAFLFAVALVALQWVEGTPLYFCGGCLAFILLATLAFNVSGGLSRTSGAYIFFYAVLVVIVGICYKAFLGEPADSNLSDPHTTIEVYVVGMSGMLAAAFLGKRFSRKTGLLDHLLKDSEMYRSSIGCIVIGIFGSSVIDLLGQSGNSIQGAFLQINNLVPLGIIIGVIYEIRSSGGRRSMNLFVAAGMAYNFIFLGIFSFSKAGMLTPLFAWLLAAWASRYRFSRAQLIAGVLVVWVIFRYLVPFAQLGRGSTDVVTMQDRAAMALNMLATPEETRRQYLEATSGIRGLNSYYDTNQGFWDRLQFISVDDALIDVTDRGKVFGLLPLKQEALNVIPHVFWPDKPTLNFGNMYAHEIGGFSDEDTTTGISFSPTAEAYHMAKWVGVTVVAPLLWFLFFVVYDSLFGDLRRTPWGLLATVLIAHTAPEGALTGVVRLLTVGVEIFALCALVAVWVAPLIASGFVAPNRSKDAPAWAARERVSNSTV